MIKFQRRTIETERLLLKPYDIKIYKDIYQLIQKNKTRLLHSFPKTIKSTETVENTKDFVQQSIFDWNNNKAYAFIIFDKPTNQLIGYIKMKNIDWKKNQTELAYFIDEDFEQKGLMTESLKKILDFCFNIIQFDRVFARIVTTNSASIKAIEKVGLKYEGTFLQDHTTSDNQVVDTYCYGISKEEFDRKKQND